MLPEVDGLTILQTLRRKEIDSQVLILTAKDSVEDRVKGLRLGADAYLGKPFAFDELLARIEVLTRRRHGIKTPQIVSGDLELDKAARSGRRGTDGIGVLRREASRLA